MSRNRTLLESAGEWFEYNDKGKWLNEMKGSISLIAQIIVTMTFSLATNPPGGVVQVGLSDKAFCSGLVCAGEAVMATVNHNKYLGFMICNTICFIASISVCLLLVSGIQINNSFSIWLLSTGMCVSLTSLALTYLFAASMVTPNSIWNSIAGNAFGVVVIVWVAFVVIVIAIYLIVRFFVRSLNKCAK
ncbi:uncharacterized protein [Cicer arietinum]|uniref:Uncharacterized protein LOC101494327 isoform X1 n=1 Tax=Cicer arietinum TaxID=3827 RepID=A0A1S2YV48_CICAR|nr:uncharacterized protein LOC101494327 isoform X1 [Cicer arietinum]